jgi:exodeoxyribonuclease VII small subunit
MDATPSFEAALELLQRTVERLESGDLGLDDSLAAYERGVRLLAQCHKLLDTAERQVALITGVGVDGTPETTPFDASAAVERESSPKPASRPRPARPRAPKPVDDDDDGIPF